MLEEKLAYLEDEYSDVNSGPDVYRSVIDFSKGIISIIRGLIGHFYNSAVYGDSRKYISFGNFLNRFSYSC